MTIEASQYINQLNSSFPRSTDLLKEGDDHIRMIKANLRNTFPNFSGPITVTSTYLNTMASNVRYDTSGTTFTNEINLGNKRVKGSGNPSNLAELNGVSNDEVLSWGHMKMFFRMMYPKDSLFITNGVNPSSLPMFAGTSWSRHWPGRYLMSSTDHGATRESGNPWTVSTNAAGGSFNFSLGVNHLPAHNHGMGHTHHIDFMSQAMDRNSSHSHHGVVARGSWEIGGNNWTYWNFQGIGNTEATDTNHLHHIVGDTQGTRNQTDNTGSGSAISYAPAVSGVCMWIRNDTKQPWEL